MLRTAVCVGLFLLSISSVCALTITSEAPGNIFLAGKPVKFEIRNAKGSVSYQLTDYYGKESGGGIGSTIEFSNLEPGWYQLTCKDSSTEASTSLGVVIDRGNKPLPKEGRICTDVAGVSLVTPDQIKSVAQMMRMAGIPWARERLSWKNTESERGKFDWDPLPKRKYQVVADAYASEGVNIYQIWHDSPKWSHPNRNGNVCPDDLRDFYNFARTAANHFANRIQVWEIWNEPDTSLLPDASDSYSAMVKAAYLGYKDGNPEAIVLQGALLKGAGITAKSLYESGTTDYFDIFNWHIYNKPSAYPDVLAAHLELLHPYGADTRPVWLTEAGISLKGSEGPEKKILNMQNQRVQCQFVPRFYAMALAAGSDKCFFFVLPNYTEGPIQFAALMPDLTPYPSFTAISAAVNILGLCTYMGEYNSQNAAVTSQVFSTPRGNVLVAWSDKDSEIIVPTDRKQLRVASIFGMESELKCKSGYVRLKVGPEAVYLLDIGNPIESMLSGKVRPRGKLPKLNPSRVVVYGHASMTVAKAENAYKMANAEAFDYTVDAYNFNEKTETKGTVEVFLPDGWSIDNPKREVTLEPMGRQTFTFRVQPSSKVGENLFKVTVRSQFVKEKIATCVSLFSYDLLALTPAVRKPLDWAQNAERWQQDSSLNCFLNISNPQPNTINIDTKFSDEEERWAFPSLQLAKPIDMSGFDAIAFDLNVPIESYNSEIRLMLMESGGGYYAGTFLPLNSGKTHILFRFADLELYYLFGPDPDQRFDPRAVSKVVLGCNVGRSYFEFEVSNFELLKFDKP